MISPLALASRLLPYGLSDTSRSISQPLANDAFQSDIGACRIINAKLDPVRIAEIELRNIAVQVAFAAMLINALHATLEDAIEALDGVCVDVAAPVFASAVIDEFMARKLFA